MSDDKPRRPFRWQALLHRAAAAVFVLDRRRRLLFINAAFERLAGLTLDRARGLHCRHARPVGPDATLDERLAHALTPPPEAARGHVARARRLFVPRAGAAPVWWDVEHFPLRAAGPGHLIIGRVLPVEAPAGQGPELLPERLAALRAQHAGRFSLELLASATPAMARLAAQLRLAAATDAAVHFVGEPGAGKHTAARVLHQLSAARERPFVALDCARLPAAALAAALGGDAVATYGALYLREPAALPRELQQTVADWLAQAAVGPTALPRVLAGSSSPPLDEVRAGRLLEALYWALAPVTIEVPPLRERRDDLPRLVERLLAGLNELGEPAVAGLAPEAAEALRGHAWPGNIAELRRALAAARARATSTVLTLDDLPLEVRLGHRLRLGPAPAGRPVRLEEVMAQVERRLIELALRRAGGDRKRAANLLGLSRARLLRRMEAVGLSEGAELEDIEEG